MRSKLVAGALAGLFLLLAAWLFGPQPAADFFERLLGACAPAAEPGP